MNKEEIKSFFNLFQNKLTKTIVIVDYGNVEKWKNSLNWKVGIKELGVLVRNFSKGKGFLRRFYYGSDYGPKDSCQQIIAWSEAILSMARMSGFTVITKRVKYIHNKNNSFGFDKKCDLDVEMTVDLIRERDNYDTIILFSGDGDLMFALDYLHVTYGKKCYVFGARGHIGREVFDAKAAGVVENILFADDFEYRLDSKRFFKK